jgi:hypothetical protein
VVFERFLKRRFGALFFLLRDREDGDSFFSGLYQRYLSLDGAKMILSVPLGVEIRIFGVSTLGSLPVTYLESRTKSFISTSMLCTGVHAPACCTEDAKFSLTCSSLVELTLIVSISAAVRSTVGFFLERPLNRLKTPDHHLEQNFSILPINCESGAVKYTV